ncbi:MAG: hypothetical protein E7028_01585 [Planctomycetaceae bacterium]|nr:hypothetical protein [Planctomycetaceae bacterium]MBQ2822208.1 hypothetical protein [Thermoguttaceae bacterium]
MKKKIFLLLSFGSFLLLLVCVYFSISIADWKQVGKSVSLKDFPPEKNELSRDFSDYSKKTEGSPIPEISPDRSTVIVSQSDFSANKLSSNISFENGDLATMSVSSAVPENPVNVDSGIELAARYIIQNTDVNGRLAYQRHLNPAVLSDPTKYNILRHAGTIYAAWLYEQEYPRNEEIRDVRIRLSEYMLKNYLREIENGMFTIASDPTEESLPEPQAKLGACGLALIGMSNLLPEKKVQLEILRGLGDFILFMQKEDGSFHSKYIYSTKSFDPKFLSLYYPGEAALGLLSLFEVDPQEKWLNGAKKALLYLADSRKDQKLVREYDHWAMLATEKLWAVPENSLTPIERQKLLYHARQMADLALMTQIYAPGRPEDGSMGGNISPCSNGTKLEGLIAIHNVMNDYPQYQKKIRLAMDRLAAFLLRAQIREPYLRGGFPGSAAWRLPGGPAKSYVVRIDNVQHILSAWINYRKIKRNLNDEAAEIQVLNKENEMGRKP